MDVFLLDKRRFDIIFPLAKRLVLSHRDGHITPRGYQYFQRLTPQLLEKEGNACVVAIDGLRLVGVLACAEHGKRFAIVVVHRDYRQRGLAEKMLQLVMAKCQTFYCEVASDNMPSLKTCFKNNMVAYDAFWRHGKVVLKMKGAVSK